MNAKIKERQHEIERLQVEIKSYRSQKEELLSVSEKLNQTTTECEKLKSETKKLSSEREEVSQDLTKANSKISEITTSLNNIMDEKEKLTADMKETLSSVEESKKKILSLEKTLKKQEDSATDNMESLRRDHTEEAKKLRVQLEKATNEREGGMQQKDEVIKEMSANLDATKKAITELKAEKENLLIAKDSETSRLVQEVTKLNDLVAEKDEKLEGVQWKRADLEKQLDKLKSEHEEEMGEMVDVVNDLKIKEDELCSAEKDLKIKTSKIDQLCKQLLQQEQSHKEQTKKKESLLDEEVKSANVKTEEAKTQCGFLKDQMAALKVEGDLQIQKAKMEFEMEMNSIKGQLDPKGKDGV